MRASYQLISQFIIIRRFVPIYNKLSDCYTKSSLLNNVYDYLGLQLCLMNSKKSTAVIYISNMSEDVWSFISSMSSSYERESEIQENARLSEHDLFNFFGYDDCLIILPRSPDPVFYQYFMQMSKNQSFKVMQTKIHTGEINKDILNDVDI